MNLHKNKDLTFFRYFFIMHSIKVFLNIFLVLLIYTSFLFGNSYKNNSITICFRCDDFFAVKNNPVKEIFLTQKKILEIFKKNNIPLTIGVIPNVHESISEDTVEYKELSSDDEIAILLKNLKEDSNFEIAMHGLSHYPNELSKFSEWIGLPFELQSKKILEGKQILFKSIGIFELDTFIPPWNSFDLNTTKALKENGFSYLSGDVAVVKNKSFSFRNNEEKKYFNLNIIPGTTSLKELNEVISLSIKDFGETIIIVIFHPYDFQEYRNNRIMVKANFNLSDLDSILISIKNNDHLIFSRIKDLNPGIINAAHYTTACKYYLLLELAEILLPTKLLEYLGFIDENIGHWLKKGRYLSLEMYKKLYIRLTILMYSIIIFYGIFSAIFAKRFFLRIKERQRIIIIIFIFLFFIASLIYLELTLELISAPNLNGVLFTYIIGFISFFIPMLILKKFM